MVGVSRTFAVLLVLAVIELLAYNGNIVQLMVKRANAELRQVDMMMIQMRKLSAPPPAMGYWYSRWMQRPSPVLNQQVLASIYDDSANLMSDLAILQARDKKMVKSTSSVVLVFSFVFYVCVSSQNADLAVAEDELLRLDELMFIIRMLSSNDKETGHPSWVIDEIASGILANLAVLQVRLISQRNGPQGELIDKTLSRIEEKSYQLKTMLIQLQQDKNTEVTYFPKEAAIIPGAMGGYQSKPDPSLLQSFG
ncbi:hypothetical protein GE061_008396 [Apolygus lucorum]|uniref:Uncharacterized protein n=1 Tax=Apolygus lucorum TaxID=248454 RepID=A0A8S9WQZ1_APOLU|nr:hypothetical protein GE061_008396 [Apolygus lucorum]